MAGIKKIVIIGAGGFAREVLDILDACNEDGDLYNTLGYIVEPDFGTAGMIVNGKPILGGLEWLEKHRKEVFAVCGIGAPEVRHRLVIEATKAGVCFCSITHPSVRLSRWNSIGTGVVISAGCLLSNHIQIGNHVQINPGCIIGHDVTIEDFVTVSPGVNISGNVKIFMGCNLGTGINVINRLTIGKWSVIGAGSTLIRDVPPNSTVVGVPGRVVKQREKGWHLAR